MRVGIVSPYFGTIGGGERYVLTAAKFFLDRGDQVDIFSGEEVNAKIANEFFGLDLTSANFIPDSFFGSRANFFGRIITTLKYDLIFFLSDGSIPISLARNNWLHFQTPFHYSNQKTFVNKLKLLKFSKIICNSKFTKRYIDKTYGTNSTVVYPPVDIASFTPGKKENLILAVGRFAKKQEILVKAFSGLAKDIPGWRLVLAGSMDNQSAEFVGDLKKKASGLPVEIVVNPSFLALRKYYATAKIFWHAVGFGEDLNVSPARAEHFGITTVEAMSAGAVPIVFAGGGQKEIVQQDISGFLWENIPQLAKKTLSLINDEKLREKMAIASTKRARLFSSQRFYDNLKDLL